MPVSKRWSTKPMSCSSISTQTKTRSTSRSFTHARGTVSPRCPNRPADRYPPTAPPDLHPLFETLLETIPAPEYDEGAPLQAHVTNLDASPFLGRLALCRVRQGNIAKGQTVAWCRTDGSVSNVRISELLMTDALERVSAAQAGPGDIIAYTYIY